MILLTVLLIGLAVLAVSAVLFALVGGSVLALTFADVIVFIGIVWIIVKVINKGKGSR